MSYNDEPQAGGLISWKYFLIPIILFIIFLLLTQFIFPTIINNQDDCINYDHKIGFLSGTTNGMDLIIDNETWFVSDYFNVDGYMPSDFSKYFNHNVDIYYAWGCGRHMIQDVKIIEG